MNVTVARYSTSMIVIHWLTAALVLTAYLLGEGGRAVRENPPVWHFATGMAVLVLVVPRLLGRMLGGAPPLAAGGSKWLLLAAKIGHGVLYLLLVALPITGWYAASRMGVAVVIAGYTLPPLTGAVAGPAGLIGDLHEQGGNVILILAGVHGLLALWHHFVRHDNTLRRMSPFG